MGKRIIILLFLLLNVGLIKINADEITINGLIYELNGNEASLKEIPSNFEGETVAIPDTIVNFDRKTYIVTKICENAGRNLKLKGLYIPSTIKAIDYTAFENTIVDNLYIDDLVSWCNIDFKYWGISTTGNRYWECYACPISEETRFYVDGKLVETLRIPDEVTSIPCSAFNNLNCETVIIGDGVTSISPNAFRNCAMKELYLGEKVTIIDDDSFYGCKNLERLYLNDNIMSMSYSSFYCPSLKEIYAPSIIPVAYIHRSWRHFENIYIDPNFSKDYTLYINGVAAEEVTVPFVREDLGQIALSGIDNIKTIICEEGIADTGIESFMGCKSLERIVFPSTLNVIDTNFFGCENLISIELKSEIPPVTGYLLNNFYEPVIQDEKLLNRCHLYVPSESIELYKESEYWGQFKNILPIDESGVESITDENQQDKVIYDLQGRKVSGENLAPGIYVIDGMKIKM